MLPSFRQFALTACLCGLAACARAPDTDGPSPREAAGNPTREAGDAYACADGTRLHARFDAHDATLRWADGREATLPRAESASKGGGDVYVGDTVSLQRDGTRLQLHDGSRSATECAPAGASPEAQAAGATADDASGDATVAGAYACDPGTRVSRNGDGSFRAEIPGNPPIRLTRIAGSRPPVFTGASLYLRVDGDGTAILSQGDRTNELRCTAAKAPA